MSSKGVLRILDDNRLSFYCPACEEWHVVALKTEGREGWVFNGNYERPTFSPSVLVQSGHYASGKTPGNCWCDFEKRTGDKAPFTCKSCHSFVTDGVISYLDDCTHEMAGKLFSMGGEND